MPYRVDIRRAGAETFDRLVELGAIDAEVSDEGGIAALMPDTVAPAHIAHVLGVHDLAVSAATGRDAGSVWVLTPRAIRVGRVRIAPAHTPAAPGSLRLLDGAAFGTGLHPTTALCLEALEEAVQTIRPDAVLDVGTGSGVLALAALMMGVPQAMGIDIDDQALGIAADNARLNEMEGRLRLVRGGPDIVSGTWPLVVANVLAAPLIEMAPALVQRVGHQGQLVLSGIPSSAERDVDEAYRHMGMRHLRATSRGGWVALVLFASW